MTIRIVNHAETRAIYDATGRLWVVDERGAKDDCIGRRSLVFATEHAVRRVRNYPANWFSLSDSELLGVSSRR